MWPHLGPGRRAAGTTGRGIMFSPRKKPCRREALRQHSPEHEESHALLPCRARTGISQVPGPGPECGEIDAKIGDFPYRDNYEILTIFGDIQ